MCLGSGVAFRVSFTQTGNSTQSSRRRRFWPESPIFQRMKVAWAIPTTAPCPKHEMRNISHPGFSVAPRSRLIVSLGGVLSCYWSMREIRRTIFPEWVFEPSNTVHGFGFCISQRCSHFATQQNTSITWERVLKPDFLGRFRAGFSFSTDSNLRLDCRASWQFELCVLKEKIPLFGLAQLGIQMGHRKWTGPVGLENVVDFWQQKTEVDGQRINNITWGQRTLFI